MDTLTRAAQALSDTTRLRIINVLMAKECCVCEVMQALEISQTRASRNLKILKDAGFLRMRTEGLFTLYTLEDSAEDGLHASFLRAVKKEIEHDKVAKEDIARLKRARRSGPGCCPQKKTPASAKE